MMPQPFSRYLHPFDPGRPAYEPEVTRALIASWNRHREPGKGACGEGRSRR
ncbi:hypothetical protein [Aurantiacibacter poecillastricola]|uniref:hypothetical protein n=1 Tax=Aurantiacibacter poecillastricola TaxID=3064385 RepID=UPI002740295D|nr:hypothetical protein [Aurantiacibacter sp. 219JJ12-13]MDP5262267.1 hypothetical protein [Aurantiacibacter sp. 219JJ12-13]